MSDSSGFKSIENFVKDDTILAKKLTYEEFKKGAANPPTHEDYTIEEALETYKKLVRSDG